MAGVDVPDGKPSSEGWVRRNIWNSRIRFGIIITLPSIVTFLAGQLIAVLIDRELSEVRARNAALTGEITILDGATRNYEVFELLRASFLLDIAASGGDPETAFRLDQLHRQTTLPRLREVAATLDPGTWKARTEDYDAIVRTDYRTDHNAGKKRLQETENAIMKDAKQRLTEDQRLLNTARDRIDVLEGEKRWWTSVLGYLGNLLSVLVFFVKANAASATS